MQTVLIADDESNILKLLDISLKQLGVEVITAENGEIAIEKAIQYKPSLVITDVVMPKKNGFEVCRAIRNIPEISDIPIMILSALGDEYNKISGFEEGADDYIIKPFNIEKLKNRAKELLFRHQSKKISEKKSQVISEIKIDNISTGHTGLDNCLLGGLPKGSNILVIGPIGLGKSSFARKFICNGLQNKEKCLWIAIDDDPQRIRQKLSDGLKGPISTLEAQNHLKFVDAYSWSSLTQENNEPFSVHGILELNQLSGVISDASFELGHTVQDKFGGRRVIDSISSLLVNFDLPSVQRFLTQIARTAVAFGGVTTLFLIEEGTVDEKELNNVKYIMDGIIEFSEKDNQRICRVAHMKWAQANRDWVPAIQN